MLGRVFLLLLLVLPLTALALVRTGVVTIPPAYDPFARLDLSAAPNFLTSFKLARLEQAPQQCLAALAASDLRHRRLPDRPSDTGCAITDAVRVEGSTTVIAGGGFAATCPLAAAWVLFEREALQPAARRHLGQRVATVRHFGSYACRNLYGRADGRRSEHATANAVDLAGFVLADGREVTVARDWQRTGTPEAAFLRAVHAGACRFFDVVLGPAYNAAHRDHLHLDMGRFSICR
jgi:hypothetical protein